MDPPPDPGETSRDRRGLGARRRRGFGMGTEVGPAHASAPSRCSRPRISVSSSLVPAPEIPPRAMTTTCSSSGTRGARLRHAARRTRRARFRSTAPPIRRPATKAGRAPGSPGATYSITRGPEARRPLERTRLISRERRARRDRTDVREADAFRPTAGSGPWPGGAPGWPDRPSSASGGGTRGASRAGACSAGRSSSRFTCGNSKSGPPGGPRKSEYTGGTATSPPGDDAVEKERQMCLAAYPAQNGRCYAPPRLPPHVLPPERQPSPR